MTLSHPTMCDASAIVAWGCNGEFAPISEMVQASTKVTIVCEYKNNMRYIEWCHLQWPWTTQFSRSQYFSKTNVSKWSILYCPTVFVYLTCWLPWTYIYVVQSYCACARDVNIRPSIEASVGRQGTAEYANVDVEAGMLLVAWPLSPHTTHCHGL